MRRQLSQRPLKAMGGFTLVELMLSLSLGMILSGVMLQGLVSEGANNARFSRLLRERAAQRRTLDLVRGDLARATNVSATPEHEQHACALSGRQAVLHLETAAGSITYSVGAAPSSIWRAQVLMRCGPAYGLDGDLVRGRMAQNRVVMDALAVDPPVWGGCQDLLPVVHDGTPLNLGGSSALAFSACLEPGSGLVGLRLVQAVESAVGRGHSSLTLEMLVGADGAVASEQKS